MGLRTVWIAFLLFCAALAGFGMAGDGYSQLQHPVALLGARGMPNAWAFNGLVLVVPGVMVAWQAWRLRVSMPRDAAWISRVAAWMLLLSALAFAMQGLLPLDTRDLESTASRAHIACWMAWWVAFVPGVLMLVAGTRAGGAGSAWARGAAMASVAVGALIAWLALAPPAQLPEGVAQRLMFVAWFCWWIGYCHNSLEAPR